MEVSFIDLPYTSKPPRIECPPKLIKDVAAIKVKTERISFIMSELLWLIIKIIRTKRLLRHEITAWVILILVANRINIGYFNIHTSNLAWKTSLENLCN